MHNVENRVAACFQAVFPDLPADKILVATPASVDGWDSLASVTLLSVLEEEFHTRLEIEDLEQLTSFDSMVQYFSCQEEWR